jgi:crossover junction endonuclease EME1
LKNTPQGSIDRGGAAGAEETRSPKKRKLTEEERTAKAADDERDKVARACEKATARAANKDKKAKEKEEEQERKRIQKEAKAREKRIAADLAEVNKSKLDKKDSTPEMIVDLPASIDGQSVNTQIREFLKTLGVDATLYQSPIPNTIRWRRKMKARWSAELDHWEPIERMEIHDEKHIMCLLSAKEFIALAMAESNDENVETHVTKLKSAYKDCVPIYMIEGLHVCMRKSKTAENRAYQERVNSRGQNNVDGLPPTSQHTSRKQKPTPVIVNEDMIEDALLRLQVIDGCLLHHTNTSVETAEWVANFTQHISTIPYRSAARMPGNLVLSLIRLLQDPTNEP